MATGNVTAYRREIPMPVRVYADYIYRRNNTMDTADKRREIEKTIGEVEAVLALDLLPEIRQDVSKYRAQLEVLYAACCESAGL